jgi:uncharacterized membrane protein
MERMLVVVFDNEKRAYQGKTVLGDLQREGSITLYAEAVVVKHADGTVTVKETDDAGPLGTLAGTAVGGLIGVLGGPVGLAIGATSGLALGSIYDVDAARVGWDFIDDVTKSLTPNKVALVAEIDEEWTAPVDARMEAIGGTVFRRALWAVEEKVRQQEFDAMEADLAQMKSEISKANAEQKAKLQKKVDQLQAKIDAQQKKAKDRREAFHARQKAKHEILKKNAAAAGRALKNLAQTEV